jgi:thioredoxin 2
MIAPALENLSRKHAGRLKVVRLNVDEAPDISARFNVQGIPLLVIFEGSQERDRLVGAAPERQIEAWLEPHLPPAPAPAPT